MRGTAISLISLLILEVAYRYQWVDFYRSEWTFQNKDVPDKAERILIFGDSFSADPDSWVGMLRDSFPKTSVFNASMPGIGPETHVLLFSDRVAQVKPNHIIVQLYVGNDLLDIEKPVNWSKHGFFRNLYWSLSNDFQVLSFINYRLGQASPEDKVDVDPKAISEFNPDTYSPRTRLYIHGDPNYPSSSIRVAKDDPRMTELCAHLRWMKKHTPASCTFSVVLIPHCTQVSARTIANYRRLGAKISRDLLGENPWKPFLKSFRVVDPLKEFVAAQKTGTNIYFANDPHLSEAGNKVLMHTVAQHLFQQ